MAIEKIIKIRTDADLDQANADLKELKGNLKDVDTQSKKTSEQIDEVASNGGAIAILDELTGGLATRMRDAFEATKLFNFSLKGTQAALLATGIGAFVVALGTVVAYWDEINDLITGANARLREHADILDTNVGFLESELGILEKQLELYELEGKNNEEILALKEQKLHLLNEENNQLIQNLELQLEAERSKAREVTLLEQAKIFLAGKLGLDRQVDAIAKAVSDRNEKTNELQERLNAAKTKQLDIEIAIAKAKRGDIEGAQSGGGSTRDAESEVSALTGLPNGDIQQAEFDADIERLLAYENRRVEIQRNSAKARVLEAEIELQQKREILNAEIGLLGQFGGLLQQIGEKNKTIAIAGIIAEQIAAGAKIIMSTSEANAKAVAASPLTGGQPWVGINTVSAALSIASNAVAAGKAISQLGGASAGQPIIAPSSLPVSAASPNPSFNLVQETQGNQIAESLASNPIKAYVTSKDVTSKQEMDRNTTDIASFG